MKQNILEKAKNIIDDRRFDAENTALKNKEIALKNKEFNKIFQNYTSLMIENAKNGITDDKELKNLKKSMEAKQKELSLPDINVNYHCKKCEDTGFVEGKYCTCLIKEINKILKEESGFSKLESFDKTNFEVFDNKEYMEKLYTIMKKWCHSNFDKNLIYLAGQTGVGKTHLLKCMANELISLNKVVYLTTSFAMNQDFLKSYSSKDIEEKDYLLQKYLEADILFIDDLGTELRQPNITVNYLYLVLNERKNNKRPTIITTNLTLEDVRDYYDERISSRIIDKSSSICVYIEGKDLRLKK